MFKKINTTVLLSVVFSLLLTPLQTTAQENEVPLITGVHALDLVAEGGGDSEIQTDHYYSSVTHWDDEGHWLEWEIDIPADGVYIPFVVFASGSDQPVFRNLEINGEEMIEKLEFPDTGGFGEESGEWQFSHFDKPVHLSEGLKTLRMTNKDAGGLSIAWIFLVSPGSPAVETVPAMLEAFDEIEETMVFNFIEALGDEDPEVKNAIANAVRNSRQTLMDVGLSELKEQGDPEAIAVLRRIVREAPFPVLQARTAGFLGEFGDRAAVKDLRIALEGDNWLVHLAAHHALELMGESTLIDLPDETADWPMWRYEPRRGAATPHELARELHLNWVVELSEPRRAWPPQMDDFDKLEFDLSYEPVVSGEMIYVPSMVEDKLTAYDIDSGEPVWEFYTDGPIRVAPVVWDGRIYVPSDDGHIYCLGADNGELLWKFRGGPMDRKVLGNERVISMWSVRGGPVIKDGMLYFAAGMWPHEGVFVYALDAGSGDLEWVNSGTGSRMDLHPHGGAYAFGGVAPQGSIAVSGDKLIVPGGRTTPAVFDRHSGEMLYFRYQQGGKGGGGYRVYADEHVYFNPRVYRNQLYSLDDGSHLDRVDAHVVAQSMVFGVDDHHPFGQLLDMDGAGAKWQDNVIDGLEELHMLAGHRLYGSGQNGMIVGLDVGFKNGDLTATPAWQDRVEGDVFRMIAARDRLFVVTTQGRIYAFGPTEREPMVHSYNPEPIRSSDDEWTGRTSRLLETSGAADGYALMFGIGTGRLLEELLLQSDLHIVAFDPDEELVQSLRDRFSKAGLYGKRVAIHRGDAMSMRLPDYIAELIVSEDPVAGGLEAGEAFAEALYRPLRPYGGTVYLPIGGSRWYRLFSEDKQQTFAATVENAELENARISKHGDHVLLSRPGPLPGSDTWTHQYSDAANSTYSADDRVFTPLGITWFGGSSNDKTLPRHMNGPIPHVVEGRLVIMGVDHVTARCVYTGRELWSVELPLVGENFTSLEHEARQAPVYFPNHPGANFIGSPYVTTRDAVYVIYKDRLLRLDLNSGEQLAVFDLPARDDLPDHAETDMMGDINMSYAAQISEEEKERWGHILVSGDYLVVAAYPHYFDDGQPGREDNWNATSSEFLLVIDRFSGEIKWTHQARYGFRHNAISVANGRIFVLDNLSSEIQTYLTRRGIEPDLSPRIRALDIHDGSVLWDYENDVYGTWLAYSQEHDVLLQAGRYGARRALPDEPRDRLLALRGEDGRELWQRNENHTGPVALHDAQRRIITGQNNRSLDLLTGEFYQVANPMNGMFEQLRFNRTYGCGTQNVSTHLITFRSGAAGYTDLKNESGTGNLAGFRSGCTNNLVVADGVLNAPDYTRSCSCSYQHQTSLAFVHMPDVEKWTYNSFSDPEPGSISKFGLNLGAPGSRVADGVMWINYPRIERVPVPHVPMEISSDTDLQWFTNHALEIEEENNGYRWVAASGVEGINRIHLEGLFNDTSNPSGGSTYTVRLHFAEPAEVSNGKRVFDVLMQGDMVLQGLDIVEKTGGARRVFVAEIEGVRPNGDGELMLEFISSPGSERKPLLSGLDVFLEEDEEESEQFTDSLE